MVAKSLDRPALVEPAPTVARPVRHAWLVRLPTAYLTPLMTRYQTWAYRALVGLWLLAVVVFWAWWLQTEHWVTPGGMLINSVMLIWATLLPAWFFLFVGRMRRPNLAMAPAGFRVAMIVTKAPSEPWPVVQRTLEGMLRQDDAGPYAVWLADEAPSVETLAWCARHGVRVSSRQGVAAYHQPTWPRRTRCKEGNLAYFYDHWGYREYDVVAQLDADHVPAPGYLRAMVRPFVDPAVGYVAAPSVCDANRAESWAVRGRLFAEAPFHGAMQAGHNGGYAPACIGSHYAIRTAALHQVGGLGPELAEDFSTTLRLTAGGWEGVFAIDAEAHGDGPSSFTDFITQEFQWSRSLTNVLLNHYAAAWPTLTWRQRLKLTFGQIWYPLYALYMLVAVLFPIIALWTGSPWVTVPLAEFYLYASGPGWVALVILWWLRRHGWLRPSDSPLLSWEVVLFHFTRWPWVLLGVAQSIVGWLLRREFGFKVTPKGVAGPKPLPLVALAPYLAITAVSAGTALLVHDPGAATGYYFFCLLNAVSHLAVAGAVLWLHLRENHARWTAPVLHRAWRHFAAIAASGVLVATALAERIGQVVTLVAPSDVANVADWLGARGEDLATLTRQPDVTATVWLNPRAELLMLVVILAAWAAIRWGRHDLKPH